MTNKTIEEFTHDFTEEFKISVSSFQKKLIQCQEEILLAFMAKYGIDPSEIYVCQQMNPPGFWVEKISDEHRDKIIASRAESLFWKKQESYKKLFDFVSNLSKRCHPEDAIEEAEQLLKEIGEINV